MTGLAIILLVVVVVCLVRPGRFPVALALSGATPAGAALIVGGIGVPTFYAAAALLLAGLVLAVIAGRPNPRSFFAVPGASLFVAFAVWAVAVTLIAPFLFNGARVVVPAGGALVPGQFTSSNLAQVAYLLLGLAVFGYVARTPAASPMLIGLAVGTTVLLSFWRYLNLNAGLPFPAGLFDNSPTSTFIQTAAGGVVRFRGILTEPAALAGTCLVCIAWAVPMAIRLKGVRKVGVLALAAVALFLGSISTSTTFVVAGGIAAVLIAAVLVLEFLAARIRIGTPALLVGVVLAIAGVLVLPYVADFVTSSIDAKVGSSSYDERSGADTASIALFQQTLGFGVGLGSNRASSFLPSLATSVGVIGVLLFALALVSAISNGATDSDRRPALWPLMVFLVTKLIAGPDLSDSSGVLWIALGLLARPVIGAREAPPDLIGGRMSITPGRGAGGAVGAPRRPGLRLPSPPARAERPHGVTDHR